MNETLVEYKNKTIEYWKGKTKKQQQLYIATIIIVLFVLFVSLWFGTRINYVPLYSNLTVQETGEIKATLDARGINSEISNGGTTILVPESMVDELTVSLAAEGIPQTGRIDYSTFRDNMGFGTTDSEFNLLERAAIQTSVEDLIRNIEGVRHAQVMITMAEDSLWLADDRDNATAAVSLNLQPGYRLDQGQIRALYHLISRSVPSLPLENIVIMDQNFQYLELNDDPAAIDSSLTAFEQQRRIQRDIERDLQRQVQQMLGTLVGQDKVLVTVSTDIDFTQENRQEQLVTPVNTENDSGIAVSIERITETFTGDEVPEGGIPGTGETDIPGYPGVAGGNSGDYERMEERINNEVNRIQREIVESPYKIRDIGIQVMVEPPDPNDPATLPLDRLDDIQQVLGQIVRTSIDYEYTADWGQDELNQRIFVTSQEFFGRTEYTEQPVVTMPYWYYIVGGVLLALVLLLLFLLLRKRKQTEESITSLEESQSEINYDIPNLADIDSEENNRRKKLEKLAKERPEEFSKLVRTWLSED
ncbi:flagellar basal-body MS-ring/collar protein FliF [Evansella sp. AB-P1]|uniref:flagellar basal-body MS-ring/collar protein FliF n=1 Tax=Evansella sp. AB-P1 TaxID=3037653 RepID=UPI00241E878F|nr:flagellar basal-body MS-ring/collar protein FliF [Evansella sp. AB-P1]MDG5788193.1 flagellar basal-body MS-ring/collar protein FliF [Evansella sp. AB-P1]